jgi:hypothetical protein
MSSAFAQSSVDPHLELARFQELWRGGYYEGDPLDPAAISKYEDLGYLSILYVTYRMCIRPFVGANTRALEIGPGRGAWTKTMLAAEEIWCLDALSAEHNRFWEHVGREHANKIHYVQVDDFSCRALPDDHFDFLFSFGTFCHIPWPLQCEYYRNLFAKMKPGAHAMVMFADFDKYNRALRNIDRLRTRALRGNPALASLKQALRYVRVRFERGTWLWPELVKHEPNRIRFHHAGIRETRTMLESIGWKVLEPDVEVNLRDPIVHFQKPID